ncbi:hypothetical protein SAMN02983003_3413 [Devosia enhydra]|uniref:Uncharacterized protein n=1 Tax=Devosia enhydra TaxID=665118 RepID=A0A1K2I1Z2_9HYPH|nr:hypothetical protein [Devosia enhydra]SFZ86235.1 hypothetical protein SAMN02983003_3413 [Devosia enhydra]
MRTVLAAMMLMCSTPAFAWTNFLNGETGGAQTQRYCRYSNGDTLPVPRTGTCPSARDAPSPLSESGMAPQLPVVIPQIVVPMPRL